MKRSIGILAVVIGAPWALTSCADEAAPVAVGPPVASVASSLAAPQSPALRLQPIYDAIGALVDAGQLSPMLAQALKAKANAAAMLLDAGKEQQGRAILSALLQQVRALVAIHVLTLDQAAPLLDATANVVEGGLSLVSVSTGEAHACGLAADGVAWCWGYNLYGQLGDGTTTDRNAPAPVTGNVRFTGLAAGGFHTCGLTADGTAYCWGQNNGGQLGNASTQGSAVPVLVAGSHTWSVLDVADQLTCGLTTDGVAYCWGTNQNAALGTASTTESCVTFATLPCSSTPIAVSGNPVFRSITTGLLSACAVDAVGTGHCWGWGQFGELGDGVASGTCSVAGSSGRCAVTPTVVLGGPFRSISAGGAYACGLSTGGAASCWGFGAFGQLGGGTVGASTAPVAVVGGLTFRDLAASKANSILGHACGLSTSGQAFCWGSNSFGQLGASTSEACSAPSQLNPACSTAPIAVDGGIAFGTISPGNAFTCGIDVGGGTYCWGWNRFGQLGDGSNLNRGSPARVKLP
ncbi:MAG TPA: hypothetical protein VKP10_14870 [Gemmatimonadales bacterium]|nr:hypothetical protein [Gemmatimonadales bacterium]